MAGGPTPEEQAEQQRRAVDMINSQKVGTEGSAAHLLSTSSIIYVCLFSFSNAHVHTHSSVQQMSNRRIEPLHVYACTWNMGGVEKEVLEAGLPRLLPQWIPRGYDLYVLGVQECQCIKELRKMIHAYLGRWDGKSERGEGLTWHGSRSIKNRSDM